MVPSGVYGLRSWSIRLPSYIPHLPSISTRSRSSAISTTSASSLVNNEKGKVIVISGPTGAGKSRLAVELAKRLNGEIISADSVQVYHGLDVGSAKPSSSDRKEVPHHLIDILHPSEDYSVGQFYEDARQATRDVLDRGHVPIITGGTGLYLRWFIYGKPNVPKASAEVAAEVHEELAEFERVGDWGAAVEFVVNSGDPKAQTLAANDWYRLRRRLEIIKTSGSPSSAFQLPYNSFKHSDLSETNESHELNSISDVTAEDTPKNLDFNFICFFLSSPRLELYRTIDFRCEEMLTRNDGILSETRWLLNTGLLPNTNSATRAIGYRKAMEYLLCCSEQKGLSSAGEFYTFLSQFQKLSRNFAKRQLTWFRNEPIYKWINASNPMEKVLNVIYDAYHDTDGILMIPESLLMKRDVPNRREALELKSYRPRNRYFINREGCCDILEWIRRSNEVAAQSI